MRKLIESTHVSLGGQIDSLQDWAFPYLDDDHNQYAKRLLFAADDLLLGRLTYEGLSVSYQAMADSHTGPPNEFVDRMNSIPKFVASTTLRKATWNARIIEGDVASFVSDLKQQPGGDIVKYGNGSLDATLIEHRLIDEFHLLLTPVATGAGQRLFECIAASPALILEDVTRFRSGVLRLVYSPA
jgi:dihydrofolate reductase